MRALPMVLALSTLSGCTSAYLTATGQFAQAAQTGSGALASSFDLSTQLCRDRADLAYLSPRLIGFYGAPSSFRAEPFRSRWWESKSAGPIGGQQSWSEHCGELATADNVHRWSLQIIGAYGWALQSVIAAGSYSGGDLSTISAAVASATQTLSHGASAPLTGGIAGVGAPLAQIVDFLLARIVAGKVRQKIAVADAPYQKILDAMAAYVDKSGEDQLRDLSLQLKDVLDELEAGLGADRDPADPIRGIEYYKFAVYWEARLRGYRASLDATKKIVADLKGAHAALVKAGEGEGTPNADELRKMSGLISEVVSVANYFKTASYLGAR